MTSIIVIVGLLISLLQEVLHECLLAHSVEPEQIFIAISQVELVFVLTLFEVDHLVYSLVFCSFKVTDLTAPSCSYHP